MRVLCSMVSNHQEHCCSVTLIVVGADLEPDTVTADLGWRSDQSWRRGERKRLTRPDGSEIVFDSLHERGGWKLFNSGEERKLSFQHQFESWFERLWEKREQLCAFHERGWEITLDGFSSSREYLAFPAATVAALARMRVGLEITFFSGAERDAVTE